MDLAHNLQWLSLYKALKSLHQGLLKSNSISKKWLQALIQHQIIIH